MLKKIQQSAVLKLAEQLDYHDKPVSSKTLSQNLVAGENIGIPAQYPHYYSP